MPCLGGRTGHPAVAIETPMHHLLWKEPTARSSQLVSELSIMADLSEGHGVDYGVHGCPVGAGLRPSGVVGRVFG